MDPPLLLRIWVCRRWAAHRLGIILFRYFDWLHSKKYLRSTIPLSFQEGFQTMNTRDAAAFFHDGKAAFHLQAGAWVLTLGRLYAADKRGLPEAKLGWFFFPEVSGGKGKANDIFGSVYGWLVSKDAPKETVDFMKLWLGKDIQTKFAAEGLSIPMVKGTVD